MHQLTANMVNNVPRWNESFTSKHFFFSPKNDLDNTYRLPKASELSPPFFGGKKWFKIIGISSSVYLL